MSTDRHLGCDLPHAEEAELGVSELRKLRQLEDENARLKRIVADLTLDKQTCKRSYGESSEGCQAALGVVCQEPGTRLKRATPAHPRHRHEPTAVRQFACACDALAVHDQQHLAMFCTAISSQNLAFQE